MSGYEPKNPYIFKSGKNKGKAVSQLMFNNYSLLRWMLGKKNEYDFHKKDTLHLHLEWLLQRGEDRNAKMLCPHCKEKVVEWISILGEPSYGYSMNPFYSCCDSNACKRKINVMAIEKTPMLFPIKFSGVTRFRRTIHQKQFIEILKTVFKIKTVTKQMAFKLFAE